MARDTSTTNRNAGPTRRPAAPLAGRARFGARGVDVARGRGRGRHAFTLVEALMASAVLAVAVIAIGTSLTTSVGQSAVVEQDSTSLLLARQLMEEIAAKPFVDPTSGTVTTNATALAAAAGSSSPSARASYNDVGDYHGYTDTIDASHPATSLQGKTAAVTNNRRYTRSVAVEFRATPNGAAATTGDLAVVTVTVTAPGGRSVSITRVATNTTLLQSY